MPGIRACRRSTDYVHGPVVVAMIPVGMMQVAINEIVYVVTVGNRFMTTSWPMHMTWLVACTGMVRGAAVRISVRDLKPMFIDMIPMRMMQVTIVQVVNVAIMFDRRMAAVRTVRMIVIFVNIAAAHESFL